MAHRKWKEAKQLPGTAGPGNMLGCCLIYFHFLWAIHPIRPVLLSSAHLHCILESGVEPSVALRQLVHVQEDALKNKMSVMDKSNKIKIVFFVVENCSVGVIQAAAATY